MILYSCTVDECYVWSVAALSLQPDDALMLMRRGDALSLLQQPEAASRDYGMAIELEDQKL